MRATTERKREKFTICIWYTTLLQANLFILLLIHFRFVIILDVSATTNWTVSSFFFHCCCWWYYCIIYNMYIHITILLWCVIVHIHVNSVWKYLLFIKLQPIFLHMMRLTEPEHKIDKERGRERKRKREKASERASLALVLVIQCAICMFLFQMCI